MTRQLRRRLLGIVERRRDKLRGVNSRTFDLCGPYRAPHGVFGRGCRVFAMAKQSFAEIRFEAELGNEETGRVGGLEANSRPPPQAPSNMASAARVTALLGCMLLKS